jgi:predicted ATPase/DNA-binding CsgD family transcriptional regulator
VGKTRLAVAVAERMADQFPDGVRFAELGAVADGAQIAGHLLSVLGVRQGRGMSPAEALTAALARRRMLLVLDNCEHVLGAVAELCQLLLGAADELRVLATSREQLWVDGEVRYRLAPLALPASADPAEVGRSEAVALFADRALRADSRFALTPEHAALAARVAARLDGMPLAIELAAGRVEALGMAGLAEHIDDVVRLLDGRDPLAAARHRSLAAVADWSYRLLSGPGQQVFRRLAVFPGSFTLEAAEAVAGPAAGPAVLRLVDCSLLGPPRLGGDQRMRYTMLQTLRTFATDQLRQAGEEQDAMAALCRFALSVVGGAAAGLETTDREPGALHWLDAEDATLNAGLDWAEAHDHVAALRLAAGLAPWWRLRGRLAEACTRLQTAVRHASPASPGWAVAQVWIGHLLSALADPSVQQLLADLADPATAAGPYTVVCESNGVLDASPEVVDALVGRMVMKLKLGDVTGAADDARRALTLARDAGFATREAGALAALSLAAFYGGDVPEALDRARQAEETLSEEVPGYLARWTLMTLTMVLAEAGEFDWARRVCIAGIRLSCSVGDLTDFADLCERKVRLELLAGALAAAEEGLRQVVPLSARIGYQTGLSNCIDDCGYLCAAVGRWAEAVTLWAAVDAHRARHGLPCPDAYVFARHRHEYRRQVDQRLAPDLIRKAEERGTRMSLYAAMEFTSILTAPATEKVQEAPDGPKLSVRERELVSLVAQGRTNAQIAAQLYISAYTVRSHLDRIRDKTGHRRRADLTRLALREGLV